MRIAIGQRATAICTTPYLRISFSCILHVPRMTTSTIYVTGLTMCAMCVIVGGRPGRRRRTVYGRGFRGPVC